MVRMVSFIVSCYFGWCGGLGGFTTNQLTAVSKIGTELSADWGWGWLPLRIIDKLVASLGAVPARGPPLV